MPLVNRNQVFLPDIHILPNGLSMVQAKGKTYAIQWFPGHEIVQMINEEYRKNENRKNSEQKRLEHV